MPSDLPIVTYNEDGNIWPTFASEFKTRLPLKNINFTNPLRPELHHIPLLEFDFKKYSPDMFPKFMPGAVQHNTFFLHLFIVSTDDMESYKNTSKNLIQEWLNVVANKKNQDWMIIYCAEKAKATRLFNMGQSTTVYEKLKTDFNLKKERFFHLSGAFGAEPKNNEAWNEVLIRIKDVVLASICSQMVQYEEDARRLEQQRLIPGWNYCQYFILKEALSFTFEVLAMYENVLVQYDELEATFFQTLYEQGAPWFKKFGGTESGDDNPNIFDLSQKNYRDRIIQNSVSIYDFRMYLFSRQVRLLNILQRPIDICIRSKLFISSFSRTIFDYRDSLPLYFRETWIYSMSLCVVRNCDELLAICNYSSPLVLVYEGLKGELFWVARYQLDRLGIAGKLINHSLHYTSSVIAGQESDTTFDITSPEVSKITCSNEQLTKALKSKYEFDDLYEILSEKCLRSFELCKRDASVMYVKADLALLYFSRQNYQKADEYFCQICFKYTSIGWNHIDTILIERYVICQRQLKANRDLIQCYLHLIRFPDFLELETYSFYLDQLKLCCLNATSIYESLNCSIFSIGSIVLIDDIGLDQYVYAEVQVFNSIVKEFEFDKIAISFKGGEGMEILFETYKHVLVPGTSYPRLRARRSNIAGEYYPSSVVLSRGKLKFLYDVPGNIQKASKLKVEESSASVLFSARPVFGVEPMILFTILTGDNSFKNALLEFETLTPLKIIFQKEISFTILDEMKNETQLTVNMNEKEDFVKLPCMGSSSIISFALPANSSTIDHKIKMTISEISDDLRKSHVHTSVLDIFFFLPFHVDHLITQSAFKTLLIYKLYGKDKYPTRLVSFEIETEGDEPVEIKELYPESNQLLFPKDSVNISALLPSNISVPCKLILTIKYRRIHQEFENFILQKLIASMDKFQVPQAVGKLKKLILRHFLRSINSYDIFYRGKIILDPISLSKIHPLLTNVPLSQQKNVQSAIEDLNNELAIVTEAQLRDSATPLIPSTYTLAKIINPCIVLIKAKWTLPEFFKSEIHVGDLLDCTLELETIIWKLDCDELLIHADMKIDKANFAFSGKARMMISVKKSVTILYLKYQLCPLKPGPLKLPLFHFKVTSEESAGVYFEGPSEKINRAILPKEECCRRCFNEE